MYIYLNNIKNKYNLKIIEFDSSDVLWQAFISGYIESFIDHKVSLKKFIQLNNINYAKIIEINNNQLKNLEFAFMFNKKNIKLKDKINKILYELYISDQIDSLKEKYQIND
jgi:ABC-type amino acid transport substrate-binding protein